MDAEGYSSVGSGGDEQVNVNIRCTDGSKYSVKTNLRLTVEEFKALLAHHCHVPVEHQRLIYKGLILEDDRTLIGYGLQADHTVHMVCGSAPVATPSLPVSIATQDGVPNVGGALGVASPFGRLDTSDAPGLFGAGLPEFEQMQQQLSQNPNMMNDPVILRSMIMSNPRMREIIDRNPELGRVLNNPSTLRQIILTARNPELRREMMRMMRNYDRAMINIESSPEGFNMLRRRYGNVQQPLLNARTMDGAAANDAGRNPSAALLGNRSGTETIDGYNSSTAGPEVTAGTTVPNSDPLPNPWNSNATGLPNHMGLNVLMNMFGRLGAGVLTAPNTCNVSPEDQYATQLSQLREMGFFNTHENIRALIATSGNVIAAVEILLGYPGQ